MRILASNPDTLGDLVLRQPMYRALQDAGHELTLVVRRAVEPLVRYVAPGAETIVLPAEVYAGDDPEHWAQFEDTFRAARDAAPDLLLVAPYRWTLFEEKLAAALPPGVRRVGMSGYLYDGDPHAGPAPESAMRFDAVAEVREDQAEVEKNAALCAAALGAPPGETDPRLVASDASLESAKQTLDRLGLSPGGYWVACVGGTAHVSIKTWPAEHWGRVLADWAQRHGRRFLFVGLPDERPVAEAVRGAMAKAMGEDGAARHAALWLESDGTLDELLALTQLSAGYVGHDTGPMHVAAAMGKPTAAVFGGGTWPRFRPAVDPSVAVLVGVPCVGCGWACSFSTSHCIKQVPVDEVRRAVFDLEEGRITGRDARVLEPSRSLQAQMITEAAVYVRQQVREKATIAQRLREVEEGSTAHNTAQQAWAEGMRTELLAAREEAHRASEAAERRAAETASLRQDLELRASESQRLAATLEAQTQEVGRLREDIRGILRDVERSGAGGNGTHSAEDVLPPDTATGKDRSVARVEPDVLPSAPTGDDKRDDEVARLRTAIERLETRVRELEPPPRPVRRPLREVLRAHATNLVIGSKYYPRRHEPHLPRVTIVTPVSGDAEALRATVESVLAQVYSPPEFVVVDVGSNDETRRVLREYDGRIHQIVTASGSDEAAAAAALARAFESAEGEVVGVLRPGDELEPGGVLRVAEFFARRPGVRVAYCEDVLLFPDGWKFPAPPRATPDVYHLLRLARGGRRFDYGLFFRRSAYASLFATLGPIDSQRGAAAEWELCARLVRRYGVRRIGGHVRSVRDGGGTKLGPADAADLARARDAFEQGFGAAGRVRCRVIDAVARMRDGLRKSAAAPRLFFPLTPHEACGRPAGPLPPGEAPDAARCPPVSPLTGRPPDRLLFSARDTGGGDRAVHLVYYDSEARGTVCHPPVALERLNAMYASREARGDAVSPPDPAYRSPYAGYRRGGLGGGALGELLQRLPTPYWWFRKPEFGDATADEALHALRGLLDPADGRVRMLNVGCFDGGTLERLKARTRWQLAGTETNARAAIAARAKGFVVWEVAPQDAPLALPVEESFDVVFLSDSIEHFEDPLRVVRRLRQLLRPGGLFVLNQPNLDSAHAEVFGPTWGRWQAPYHRVLMGRRGLRRMAALADLRVVRYRTRTLPYPTCVSVQLNRLGLGATVPDAARFPNDVASRGVRLTGWSRLLWDWRGRGDFMFAVLEAL